MACRPSGVVDRPLDPRCHIVVSVVRVGIPYLYRDNLRRLCDTTSSPTNGAGHVCAVAIAIGIHLRFARRERRSVAGAPIELRVRDTDTGVDDVHDYLMRCVGLVHIIVAGSGAVGDGAEAPAVGVIFNCL